MHQVTNLRVEFPVNSFLNKEIKRDYTIGICLQGRLLKNKLKNSS